MSRFVNGVYAGWLTTKGAKRRLGATIRFSGRALEGAGDVGGVPCTVVGTYSFAPPYGVTISFLSTDGSSIELNGWSEKERGGLFGSGVDAGVSCTFVLDRVGDLPEASPPRAAQDDGEAHVETLVSMGFARTDSQRAIRKRRTLEGAIEYLISMPEDGGDDSFTADAAALQQLIAMGIDEDVAVSALAQSSNDVEGALAVVFNEGDDDGGDDGDDADE